MDSEQLTAYQRATIVEATLSGRLPGLTCGHYMSAYLKQQIAAREDCTRNGLWIQKIGGMNIPAYLCNTCAPHRVSASATHVEFLPTGETIDRAVYKSIASLRRRIRKIIEAWQ